MANRASNKAGLAPVPFELEDGKGGFQPMTTRLRTSNKSMEVPPEENHPSIVMITWDLLVCFLQREQPPACRCTSAEAKLKVTCSSYSGAAVKIRIACSSCEKSHGPYSAAL
jgi:hypothetical protein